MSRERELVMAEAFVDLADTLVANYDVIDLLHRLTEVCVELLAVDAAGLLLSDQRSSLQMMASSCESSRLLELFQLQADQGPCLDSFSTGRQVRVDDLATEDRWPKFSRRAAEETGVASMLSFRLFAEGDTMGALNLYSKQPSAFDDEALAIGSVFATHAAVALAGAQQDEEMHKALQSRDVIGQAKGILMAQQGVSADEAFDILRRASQRMNIKLRELAERVASRTPPEEGGAA